MSFTQTKKFLALGALASSMFFSTRAEPLITSMSITNPSTGAVTNQGYFVRDNGTEKKIFKEGHHFLSVLTEKGIFAIRPHPGIDVDGWGSTLYLQPFIGGADLHYSSSPSINIVTNNGIPMIKINAQGSVSRGTSQTYGSWSNSLNFTYNSSNKTIHAQGTYGIKLPGTLAGVGELSIYKLASNFLKDVPVLNGSTTNTGDMAYLEYNMDKYPGGFNVTNIWNVVSGTGYPQDWNNEISAKSKGEENLVDTVRQGYNAINAASKPSLEVLVQDTESKNHLMLGFQYDSGKSQDFTADNVGIVVYTKGADRNGQNPTTSYSLNVEINSSAIPQDKYSSEVTLTSIGTNSAYQGIYFATNLTESFVRVGSAKKNGSTFAGKVKVDSQARQGYFKTKE